MASSVVTPVKRADATSVDSVAAPSAASTPGSTGPQASAPSRAELTNENLRIERADMVIGLSFDVEALDSAARPSSQGTCQSTREQRVDEIPGETVIACLRTTARTGRRRFESHGTLVTSPRTRRVS